jgi:TPR repeat protein
VSGCFKSSRIWWRVGDTENQQSAIELKLSQVQDDFSQKSADIRAAYEVKINGLPTVFAKQLKDKQDNEKHAAAAKILAFDQSQADNGDPFGLLRMGERYRDGDGVPKDLIKAREYLTKASTVGSPTATEDLSKLDQTSPDSSDTATNIVSQQKVSP